MKGIILAGGTGSRLMPLTRVTNKCLLPLGEVPMILHVMRPLLEAGITDIMFVTGTEHMGAVVQLLGSGKEFGCSLTYRIQDESNGIAAALALCESFVGTEKFAVVLGDNVFESPEEIAAQIKEFARGDYDYGLFVKDVPDPERFGVPEYGPKGEIVSIAEKPKIPASRDAIVGLYLYQPDVFDIIRNLSPSARGEYEISDVNSRLVRGGYGRSYRVEGGWIDAGTHKTYAKAIEMVSK